MTSGSDAGAAGRNGHDTLEVCSASDLSPGERCFVEYGAASIGVFNIDGEYHALLNRCPHRGGPVCEGDVVPAVVADWPGVGERRIDTVEGPPSITCPWHGWEFDVRTGTHLGDDTIKVPTFEVVESEGVLYVVV